MPPRSALAAAAKRAPTSSLRPLDVGRLVHEGAGRIPDPIEFVLSDRYLGKTSLYPRQGTMMKVIFLWEEGFTQYDYDVVGEWEETFMRTGNEGIAPGVLERMKINREQGRRWFREVLGVIGRRGGKGHLGALCGAYITWCYMNLPGGPQAYYGIDPNKRLTGLVFGSKKEQAIANQWSDLTTTISAGRCFQPYISRDQTQRLTLYTPADLVKMQQREFDGVDSERDQASIEIVPSATTATAGRGPASFIQFYDEMGHMVKTGAGVDAAGVYAAATPSLDQFGRDGFIYAGSSPWQMNGQLWDSAQQAIEMEDGKPVYPASLLVQLPSWGPYEDWNIAHRIPINPPKKTYVDVVIEGQRVIKEQEVARTYPLIRNPVQQYDDDMRLLERANPETFAVERKSHWAASINAYLDERKIQAAFCGGPMAERGPLSVYYAAHGDPAKINDNFGFAIGHALPATEETFGLPRVKFDLIRSWRAQDFEPDQDGVRKIDYPMVQTEIERYIERFTIDHLTFDQFNSIQMIGNLNTFVQQRGFPKRIQIYERTATANSNWREAETMKAALNMNLIELPTKAADGRNSPDLELLELELRFLEEKNGKVDHPSSGPVQTKDIADAVMAVTHHLIGEQMGAFLNQALGAATSGTSFGQQGSPVPQAPVDPAAALGALMSAGRMAPGTDPARGGRRR